MASNIDAMRNSPHPEEPAKRASRRTHRVDAANRLSPDLRRAACVRERGDDLARDRRAFDAAFLGRVRHDPDALLGPFDRELVAFEQAMLHGEAALAPLAHAGFANEIITPARGNNEPRARIDQRRADRAVLFPERAHREAGAREEMEGASIEPGEITW